MEAEIAESVAEVFSRYASGGVVIASTEIHNGIDSDGIVSGPLLVSAYLEDDKKLEERQQKIEHALASLRMIQPIPQTQYEKIIEKNWMESWKKNFKPLEIASDFLILPAWIEIPETNRKIIRIDPGMAFGTGVHPTTQLSLQLLEDHITKEKSLLDIGCGSGILSIAGDFLGADPVFGIDIDSEAVENALLHARLNQSKANFAQASISELSSINISMQQADVVVANMLVTILLKLLDEGLTDLVSEDGLLILSGILKEQAGVIEQALHAQSFQIQKKITNGDWIAVLADRIS